MVVVMFVMVPVVFICMIYHSCFYGHVRFHLSLGCFFLTSMSCCVLCMCSVRGALFFFICIYICI